MSEHAKIENTLDYLLNSRDEKTTVLNKAIATLTSFNVEYSNEANKLICETDFKEVLNDSRPTVAMKDAWVELQLKETLSKIKV